MEVNAFRLSRIHRLDHRGLNFVEYLGLRVIAVATIVAGYGEWRWRATSSSTSRN